MAKVKNPFHSFSAHGTIAKTLTFLKRPGSSTVINKPIPEDPRSLAQLSWRHMYQKAVALWHALSEAEKQDWESQARSRHMTGYAWFISQALKPNPGLYLPLQGGTMQGDIHIDGHLLDGLADPLADTEASPKKYVDDEIEAAKQKQGCRVFHSTFQSVQNENWLDVTFNSERWDTDEIHSTTVNPERLTCKTAGKYQIQGNLTYQANAAGIRRIAITQNDTFIAFDARPSMGGALYTYAHLSTITDLEVNDFVTLNAWQNTGGTIWLFHTADFAPEFMMHRIG